jgi:hypothetical protein
MSRGMSARAIFASVADDDDVSYAIGRGDVRGDVEGDVADQIGGPRTWPRTARKSATLERREEK